ncbi:lipase family protein [Pectinatus sottacetonis]|uniref:lipase family protein n=1 Tax=Pectinatus sottacetonis TaxID=1002795 RepID=UPI0018C6D923|nr:lipase family protein [Pectinatus sottacetonis]
MLKKKCLFANPIIIFLLLIIPKYTSAQNHVSYKAQYICSLMSMAAYDDEFSSLAKKTLSVYGWHFESFDKPGNNLSQKFFLAYNNNFKKNENSYILAIRGTSDYNDITSDIKISLIPFPQNKKSTSAVLNKQQKDAVIPMVHSGFNKYVDEAFFTEKFQGKTLGQSLVHLLKKDHNAHLYITGHSLGGAAAILTAVKLTNLGISPTQISVITFGSPAIGNEAFAKIYGSKINLLRIVMSGDSVRNLAQIFNSHYKLFGREIKYFPVESYDNKLHHRILLYVDMALRRYYQNKQKPPLNDLLSTAKVIYTAPSFHISTEQYKENIDKYICLALADTTHHYIKGSCWTSGKTPLILPLSCKYIVNTDIVIARQKYVKNSYYTSISYTIYNTHTNRLITVISAATNTVSLTPVEAVLYNSIKLQPDLQKILVF